MAPMLLEKPPVRFPSLVRIEVLQPVEGASASSEALSGLKSRLGDTCSEVGGWLLLDLSSAEGCVKVSEGEAGCFLVAALGLKSGLPSLSSGVQEDFERLVEELRSAVGSPPLSVFTIRVGLSESLEGALLHLEEYLRQAGRSARSMGVVRGCLLATLGEAATGLSCPIERDLAVVPFGCSLEDALDVLWGLCLDVALLASYGGRLNELRVSREPALRQIDASEKSTQMRINEIFASLRLPSEEVEEGLEGVLREVTTLFSSLSILVSAMRRDHVRAQVLLRRIESLFRGWGEEPLKGYPTNSTLELDAYRSLVAPFGDFISRVEALRVQLNTVLDAVRTYLGIQEQKLSMEEQTSSKSLLERLVRLQEVLHKLEVLIVAFYITEMGRLVFEALAHEMVNVLTALFIPVALILAILVSRMLHREH